MKFKSQNISRIRFVSLGVVLIALIFVGKLYLLQIVKHDDFVLYADKQYVKPSNQIFNRGSIFFQSKDGDLISAATLKSGYTLVINPNILQNSTTTFEKINGIFPINEESFYAKALKINDPHEEIAKRVPPEKAKEIQALSIKGVQVFKEQWRFYPGGEGAAHLIGLVAFKENELGGRYGLEKFYNETLSRDEGDLYANFFVEIFSNIKKTVSENAMPEGDIIATIEPTVEASLEDAVEKIGERWASEQTGGIIINPQNGEIYAMSVRPTFDPNDFSKQKDASVFSNPIVEHVYEMGSIIKPLTLAAGIDNGSISGKSTYFDKGFVSANTQTIYNHGKIKNGQTSMQEVLNQSLNTGAAYVMQKMGKENFAKYMNNFGLSEKTGIDLPNEALNIVTNLKSPRDIEYITASFGQGIALTPISTVRALSALGNGGILIDPHIVKKINYKTGLFKTIEIREPKQVLKKETSEEITRLLVEVVDSALLGGKGKNPHYSIGAKTGTAQIAKPGSGGYYEDRYLHSFFGYFPAYDPKFLVFLYTVNPKTSAFAADTLGQSFFDLSDFLINYYDVPPDR